MVGIWCDCGTLERGKMLTPEQEQQAVEEFKVLYKKQYGVELSDEEATEKAQGILQLLTVALHIA